MASRPFPKLSHKFFGPYKILERIGIDAYQLQLPADSQIHPVFHVSQLKEFKLDFTPVFSKLPVSTDFSVINLLPELILKRRLVKKGNAAMPKVRVKWQGLPEEAFTWDDWYVLLHQFPMVSSCGQADS
jgi:hypothetical protein